MRYLFLFVFLFNFTFSLFLRVETGHQNIAIDGRDTYYGHFTKIYFHNLTCLNSIDINCLKELTGAEEIDLLYSECQHGSNWKVVHYTNSKHHFRLKESINAYSLLISSRIDLSIIDVQVQSCKIDQNQKGSSSCHREHLHNHRHSKNDQKIKIIKARDITSKRRSKRDTEIQQISGNTTITQDILVNYNEVLSIVNGARLLFSKGTGIIVHGKLIINGTTYQPIMMESLNENEKWKGIYFQNAEPGSIVSNVLISGSETGIKIENGTSPTIEHVITQKNQYGIQIKNLESSTHLHKVTAIKNEKSGIEYIGKAELSIDYCVTASNGEFGIFAVTETKVVIRKSTSYSNNGSGIYIGSKNGQIEDTVINSNGYIGLHCEVSDNLQLSNVNISAHFSSFSTDIYMTNNAHFSVFQSHFYDNKAGIIRLVGHFQQPNVIISNSRFIRNNGPIIVFDDFQNSQIQIEKCFFISNNQQDNGDSIISIRNISDGNISIDQCDFSQNTYSNSIILHDTSIEGSLINVENCRFSRNIGKSTIFTNSPKAQISTSNFFENPKTDCDLTFTLPRISYAENNLKICSGEYHRIENGKNEEKEENDWKNEEYIEWKIDKNGKVEESQIPYIIKNEIIIGENMNITIEGGTVMDFSPGIGITIQENGILLINGTNDKPVVMRGLKRNIWRGIMTKQQSICQINNILIEDVSIGIWIDSKNINIKNGIIRNSIVHAIEITDNSNQIIDFGGLIIEQSIESSIAIDERTNDLDIQNVIIRNSNGNGIDYMTPTQNIQIRNVQIDNVGGYGIHIAEFPSSPLHSVMMDNVTIINQKRGDAGILITGGWIQNIAIHNSIFENNHVPSLIIAIECHDNSEKLIQIQNSNFTQNRDITQHIQLGSCVNVQMENNNYTLNNLDGIGSTVVITTGPWPDPTSSIVEISNNIWIENHGIYTLTLGRGTTIYVEDNLFENNTNSGAIIKIEDDHVKLKNNIFNNPSTKYTISYNEETPFEIGPNNWTGLIDAPKGIVRFADQQDEQPNLEKCSHLSNCSNQGICRDSICICQPSFTGFDCSVPLNCNCSSNGLCDIFNKCQCNIGWTGINCNIPTSICFDDQCLNGHCNGPTGQCKCDNGWKGIRCNIPICTSTCSLNGQCVGPEKCECFDGYKGDICQDYQEENNNICDFDCDNGICDSLTRSCSCFDGWQGGACDICRDTKCPPKISSKVEYILPSTAMFEDTNTVVTVFGNGFDITPNNSYICTFGRTTVLGRRISSQLIRCPIPSNMSIGRHLFSISKPDQLTTVPNIPIHFTIYDGCDIRTCQGSCIGPFCICPQGKTGIFCDVIELKPTIDRRFLEHQRANQAIEGTPYVVMMPTLTSSILRVNSTIPDLNFIASKGILAWPDPIGSIDPYQISISIYSPAGQSEIEWNVTVQPQYTAEINDIRVENGIALLTGQIITNSTLQKQVPIRMRFECDGIVDEILGKSDNEGHIEYSYIPMGPSKCEATIGHPGETLSLIPYQFEIPEFNMKLNGQSDDKSLQIQISSNYSNCQARLIQPVGKQIEDFNEKNEIILQYETNSWNEEVLGWVKCDERPMEIVHAPPNNQIIIKPTILSIDNLSNQLYEIEINLNDDNDFNIEGPIREVFREKIGKNIYRITMEIMENNGKIWIRSKNMEPKSIDIQQKNHNYMNFKICAKDEFDGQDEINIDLVTIHISNRQLGVDISKQNIRINVQWGEFAVLPNYFYNLQIISPQHIDFYQTIFLDQNNLTFCIDLKRQKSIITSNFEIRTFDLPYIQSPFLDFQPQIVSFSGQKILVTPKGSNGTIGVWNQKDDYFEILPNRRSVSINQSFWISIIWQKGEEEEEDCGIKKLEIPFAFLPSNGATLAMKLSSPILIKTRSDSNRYCDNLKPAQHTDIMCNCGDGKRDECRIKYRTPLICGGQAWKIIADDTVSIQILVSFLSLILECNEVSVRFQEIRQALQCVASIENECPLGNRIKREEYQMDSPVNIVNHLSSVKMDLGNVLPILNALDIQTIRISTIFINFFDQLDVVFPPDIYNNLDRDTLDHFIESIGDYSDKSNYISENEYDEKSEKLMNLWNNTVINWQSGKKEEENGEGILYENVKKLVEISDKLKSISRQNGASEPFEMLNGYMERQLEIKKENGQKICGKGYVYIDEKEYDIEEGDNVRIRVWIQNVCNYTLTNIGVKLTFKGPSDNIRFELGPSWSSGIQSLEGMGVLEPNSNFEIHWTRYVNVAKRLTTAHVFEPEIIVGFSREGRPTQQKLSSSNIRIIPKKIIKTINIIRDNLSPSSLNFSMITSIINPGYSTLSNVKIIFDSINISENDQKMQIDSIFINGKETKPTLRHEFDEISSGTTKMIRIALKNMTSIKSANISCIENNRLLEMESIETYAIRASGPSDYGMLLAPINQTNPLFFFQQSAAKMVNVIKLEYLSSQKVNIPNYNNDNNTIWMAAFRNPESSSFEGALWATMPIPDLPGDVNHLVKIMEHSSSRPRELQAVQWFSNENGTPMINWIDSGVLIPQKVQTYELRFTGSIGQNQTGPEFDDIKYRIEVPIESKNSEIGQITANGNGPLEYFLYSPNNDQKYEIDQKTGKIYQNIDEQVSDLEYCLLLEVRDSSGKTTQVPVSINNGGARTDCYLFSTTGLEPKIYRGTVVNTVTTQSTTEYTHVTYPDSTLSTVTLSTTLEQTTVIDTSTQSGITFETSTVIQESSTVPSSEDDTTTVTQDISTQTSEVESTTVPSLEDESTTISLETTTVTSLEDYSSTVIQDISTVSSSVDESTTVPFETSEISSTFSTVPETHFESTTVVFESTSTLENDGTTTVPQETSTVSSEFTTLDYSETTISLESTTYSEDESTTVDFESSTVTSLQSESTISSTEVTGILPTDPTTTELIYTVTSDSNLEPITQQIYTITPDRSPETLQTINPNESENDRTTITQSSTVSSSTVSSSTISSYTVSSSTVLPSSPDVSKACQFVSQSPIYKIVCDLSKISEIS